jgi:hypothetical protein
MEKNCIILDMEQNDLKIALLCMGLKLLTEGWNRSEFVDSFKFSFN